MKVSPDSHRSRCRSFGLQEHSIAGWESVVHDHSHRRWQNHRIPCADPDIDQGIGLGVHRSHPVEGGIGQETEWAWVRQIEVQLVGAFRRTEESTGLEYLGTLKPVQLEGYSLVEIRRSQAELEPCPYPTVSS